MNRKQGAVKIGVLTSVAVLAAAMTARAQGVQPLQPKELPSFILPTEPTEASAAETQGRMAYLSGDFSGAILAYTRLLQLRPNDAQAHFNRGLAELTLNQNVAAERDFSAYLSKASKYRYDEKAAAGYLQRGRARAAQNRLTDALSDFSRAITAKPPYFVEPVQIFSPPDLIAFAFMERAAIRYRILLNSPVALASAKEKNEAYTAIITDYDDALAQNTLRPEQAPVALFNRALIVETQAADAAATPNAETATARYAATIKGYEAYLQAAPQAADAAQIKRHIAQIGVWLVANENAARPMPPAAFVLKPTP